MQILQPLPGLAVQQHAHPLMGGVMGVMVVQDATRQLYIVSTHITHTYQAGHQDANLLCNLRCLYRCLQSVVRGVRVPPWGGECALCIGYYTPCVP